MAPRHGRRPSTTQNGPEVECVSGPGSELMKLDENQGLEQVLESAVVVSWADLMHGAQTGLIRIEYGFAPSG